MAENALKTINRIARTLKSKHPGMKHSSAIKQASAIYRKDHAAMSRKKKKSAHPRTHHTIRPRRRVGSAKRKTTGADRTDNKRVSVTIGGMSVAKARKYLKDQAEEKLKWGLLHRDQATTKTERRKYGKKVAEYRRVFNQYK